MSARDWLEILWHASLLLLAISMILRLLLRHRWLRAAFAVSVLIGLAYHVAVVAACQEARPLCYWR